MKSIRKLLSLLPKDFQEQLRDSWPDRVYVKVRDTQRLLTWRTKNFIYFRLTHPELLPMYRSLQEQLVLQESWPHPIYAHGYFYQGFDAAGISGKRNTEERYIEYEMEHYLKPECRVLEIGSNSGFFSIKTAVEKNCSIDAIELNPYLLEMGRIVARHFKVENKINFLNINFLDFQPEQKYDAIFSFANHFTTDGNLRVELFEHFENLKLFLAKDGMLFFESHKFDPGSDEFLETMEKVKSIFEIIKVKKLECDPRLFYVLKNR